ncbi:MAG: hypothetical protein SVN78_00910 [Deferribacterota bacterium]|nr:hypothetical protein [Deferribacterota bacterium]
MKYLESLSWSKEDHAILQMWLDFASSIGISEESIFLHMKKLNIDLNNIENWFETILTKINEAIFKDALKIFRSGTFYEDKDINRKFREYFQIMLQDNVYDWFPSVKGTNVAFNNVLDNFVNDQFIEDFISKYKDKRESAENLSELGNMLMDGLCEMFEKTYSAER